MLLYIGVTWVSLANAEMKLVHSQTSPKNFRFHAWQNDVGAAAIAMVMLLNLVLGLSRMVLAWA